MAAAADEADVQDLLFLGPLRPVLLRLRVTIYGTPFRQLWREHVERLFKSADGNGDGVLSAEDPDEIASLAGAAAGYLDMDAARTRDVLRQWCRDEGGRMDLAAVLRDFERAAPPLAAMPVAGRNGAGQALFALIDADGDQRLTADELKAAEGRLRGRDFDDDEILIRRELVDAPQATVVTPAASGAAKLAGTGPIYLLGPDASGEAVRDLLLAHYDRDGDRRLTAQVGSGAELWLATDQLTAADTNGDGALDADELEKFCPHSRPIELAVNLGAAPPRAGRQSRAGPAGAKIEVKTGGKYAIDLGDARIELRRNNRNPAKNTDQVTRLANFDGDNNGYLDAAELKDNAELSGAFAAMDADGDGKVFAAEFDAYFDRQNEAAAARLLLEVADDGQDLLQMLDTNHDYRLTTRELRAAADVLSEHDADGDGRLSGHEIPQIVELEISRNTPARAQAAAARPTRRRGGSRSSAERGPVWFWKMDRNGDGDVSRREFLGPVEAFERLDANHDGLIDAAEAEAK